ncbi:hypothetical protein, partial [Escherichia coli]|uniref:hypothetical protein n=1 Tax=Escherichia coli TaxID=562 RepID=UPI00215AB796
PVRRRAYRTHRGDLLFAVDEAAFWGEAACPRCLRRTDLQRLLAEDLPAETIRRGCTIRAVQATNAGVTVDLGAGGVER